MDLKPLAAVLTFVFTFAFAPGLAEADQDYCRGVNFDIKRPLVVAKVSVPSPPAAVSRPISSPEILS